MTVLELRPGLIHDPNELRAATASLLDRLGDTPAEVAATLARGGHRGPRHCAGACPVADYLAQHLTGRYVGVHSVDPSVGDRTATVTVEAGVRSERLHRVDVPLPLAVSLFIDGFDHGHWPALEAGEAYDVD